MLFSWSGRAGGGGKTSRLTLGCEQNVCFLSSHQGATAHRSASCFDSYDPSEVWLTQRCRLLVMVVRVPRLAEVANRPCSLHTRQGRSWGNTPELFFFFFPFLYAEFLQNKILDVSLLASPPTLVLGISEVLGTAASSGKG